MQYKLEFGTYWNLQWLIIIFLFIPVDDVGTQNDLCLIKPAPDAGAGGATRTHLKGVANALLKLKKKKWDWDHLLL